MFTKRKQVVRRRKKMGKYWTFTRINKLAHIFKKIYNDASYAGTTRTKKMLAKNKMRRKQLPHHYHSLRSLFFYNEFEHKRVAGPKISETYSYQGSRSCFRTLKSSLSLQNVLQVLWKSLSVPLFPRFIPEKGCGNGHSYQEHIMTSAVDSKSEVQFTSYSKVGLFNTPREAGGERRETIINSPCAWGSEYDYTNTSSLAFCTPDRTLFLVPKLCGRIRVGTKRLCRGALNAYLPSWKNFFYRTTYINYLSSLIKTLLTDIQMLKRIIENMVDLMQKDKSFDMP